MADIAPTPNPLLARLRIPGETFRLPSHGMFYTDGELDESVRNGEVEVHPMTAIDEITLNTPDKLLSGRAILEIFAKCIPQIKQPDKLLAKDVDFLLVCLRMVSFGQFMEVSYRHNCDDAKDHTYQIDMLEMIRSAKVIDPTTISSEYQTAMQNGQTVVLKPLTYGQVIQLYQSAALSKTSDISYDEAEMLVVNTLASVISKVDDVTSPELIREWVINLPLGWKRELERAAQQVSQWGVDFTTTHTCKDCKQRMPVTVSANPVSFFT